MLPFIVGMLFFAGCTNPQGNRNEPQQPPGQQNDLPTEPPVIITPGDATTPGTTNPSDTGPTVIPQPPGNDIQIIPTKPSDNGTNNTKPSITDMPSQPSGNGTNNTKPSITATGDTCTVSFQPDPSGMYYIVVKTDSAKKLTVACPDGSDAKLAGGLYYCGALDPAKPVIAYLDGVECGSATLSGAAVVK
ncbi:Uncharacterised protein [uncultured archaeon]|nr:Uncharacterised protein [uncultured archaeon]